MAAWRWRNVPLPEPHLVGLGTGIALDVIVGGRLFSAAWVGHASGWPLVAAGIGLAAWAVAAAGPVDLERPGTVVASGPYAWTRNPMYLGWSLLYVGVALILNGPWPLVVMPLVLVWTHVQVVREERALRDRLGPEYLTYAAHTRRYL